MSGAKIIHKRRSHGLKSTTKATSTVSSLGISAAQMATGTSSLKVVSALAAGTAVGATGVGLLIGAGALTLGVAAQAGRSAYKTNKHVNNLKQVKLDTGKYDCPHKNGHDHNEVIHTILPYIIEKKRSKLHRKTFVAGTLGTGGALESSRAIIKKAYKFFNGSLGKNRTYYANVLARHFLQCECGCTDTIVGELYSTEEMNMMIDLKHDAVVELLKDKMKSV